MAEEKLSATSNPEVLRSRLLSLIEQSQGVWRASLNLGVRTSTLKKLLDGQRLTEPTKKKIAQAFSPASLSCTSKHQKEGILSNLRDILLQDLNSFKKLTTAGVNPTTLKKLLSGKGLSYSTVKKLSAVLEIPLESVTHSPQQGPLLHTISALIANDRCVYELSSRAGVNRATIRKVLAKQIITPLAELKLRRALADLEDREPNSFSRESATRIQPVSATL